MFSKKINAHQETLNPAAEAESLKLWQNFGRHLTDFLAVNKTNLRTLPVFNLKNLLDAALAAQTSADMKLGIDRVRSAFEHTRRDETKHLNQYILGLRTLLWNTLNHANEQCSLINKETRSWDHMHDQMIKALDSDDIMLLKIAVKDWVVLQNQLLNERNKLQLESQARFQHQLSRLQNELHITQAELELDGLTQVYNRRAFDLEIVKTLQISQLSCRASCLLLFDIDHFKNVNDTYGHPVGDKVLQYFAKLIVQNFPARTDFVARYGGEEFIVIMHDCSVMEAGEKAARFVSLLRKTTMSFGSVSLRVTVSIGVAASRPLEKAEDWIERADRLLYQAKGEGRDCYLCDAAA